MSAPDLIYRFGVFELDARTGELRKAGVRIKLGGQPLAVLTLLVQRAGDLVTRDELKEALWKEDTFTDFDHGVNTAVQRIRRTLDDSATSPRFIETLPRKGYRFIAPVEVPQGKPAAPSLRSRLRFATAFGLLAATVGAWSWIAPSNAPVQRPLKFVLAPGMEAHNPAVSPDGRYVAFVTYDSPGALWVRDLSATGPRRIPETDRARRPFWSPDSRHIGFGARSSVWRVEVSGKSPPREICKRCSGSFQGASWSPDGKEILFTNGLNSAPAGGGEPTRVPMDSTMGYEWDPHFLPTRNGRAALFHQMTPTGNLIRVVDLERREYRDLGPGRHPVYSTTGHLLYQDEGPKSRIWAQPFSLRTLKPTGERFLVADNAFAPSVSDNGQLVYLEGDAAPVERLVWRNRSGGEREIVSVPLPEARFIDLSPDETKVVYGGVADGRRSVFIADLERPDRPPRQFTFGESGTNDNAPKWSPDGTRIAYISHSDREHTGLGGWIKPLNGGPAGQAFSSRAIISQFWPDGRDGRLIVHGPLPDPDGAWTIQYGQVRPDGSVRLQRFLQGPEGRSAAVAKVSPDGRHIVYAQQGSVLVRTFPDGRGSWRISRPGERAGQPRWSPAGDEILYVTGGLLVAVSVSTESDFTIAGRQELFRSDGLTGHAMPMYDVSNDGRRIILLDPVPSQEPTLRVTQNWHSEFRSQSY